MQGLYNDAIIHPEALVISDELLTDYVPFVKINDVTVTQFGEISLLWIIEPLKFFIGTNNMTVINNILKALRDIDAEFYVDVVKSPLNNVELPYHALQKKALMSIDLKIVQSFLEV